MFCKTTSHKDYTNHIKCLLVSIKGNNRTGYELWRTLSKLAVYAAPGALPTFPQEELQLLNATFEVTKMCNYNVT